MPEFVVWIVAGTVGIGSILVIIRPPFRYGFVMRFLRRKP